MQIRPKNIAQEGAAIGQTLVWNGTMWVPGAPAVSGSAIIMFGAQNISAAVATRYLYPGFSNNQAPTAPAAPDTPPSYRVPRAGTIRNLYLRQNDPRGNGNVITYTLLKNGVATALTVTIASTAYDASDLVNSVAVAQGDRISFQSNHLIGLGTSPYDIFATMEFL
jgi:hypothetical protein